jgi:hypothetical protein
MADEKTSDQPPRSQEPKQEVVVVDIHPYSFVILVMICVIA